jgi:hypothetical protein
MNLESVLNLNGAADGLYCCCGRPGPSKHRISFHFSKIRKGQRKSVGRQCLGRSDSEEPALSQRRTNQVEGGGAKSARTPEGKRILLLVYFPDPRMLFSGSRYTEHSQCVVLGDLLHKQNIRGIFQWDNKHECTLQERVLSEDLGGMVDSSMSISHTYVSCPSLHISAPATAFELLI